MRCPETVSPHVVMASSVIISSPQNKAFFMAVTISLIPFVKLPGGVFELDDLSGAFLAKGWRWDLYLPFFRL